MMVMLANALAEHDVETSLALATASGPYLLDVSGSVKIIDLRSASVASAVLPLSRHLRQATPNAVLAAMSHANVAAALAWRLAGRPGRLVLSERAHFSSARDDSRTLGMMLTSALMKLTYPWASCIAAVSQGVASDLMHHVALDSSRVVVAYNPVVGPELQRQSLEAPDHPWLLNGATPVILGAGRLIAQKDFPTLIRAFAIVRRDRKTRLLIYGEGPDREALLRLAAELRIEKDVDLPGFTVNPFAPMRTANVFVLSSRYEGLPGVLIQAMACGARVVSTDCPSGPAEILENGRWGRLVPVGNAEQLADAILEALDDPNPPRARDRAADYSVDTAVTRYASALGLTLTKARPR